MKSILRILLISTLLSSCARNVDDKVLMVEKTHTYHRPTCAQVMMAHTKVVTRTEAREKNCRPCPACKPDQPQ